MGYSTNFVGELKFATELTTTQLAALNAMLGEDARDHPDWERDPKSYVGYIDLELLPDFSGLRWSGAEKTCGLEESVNIITRQMRKQWPGFRLVGQLNAQGEDFEDRWSLVVDEHGVASKAEIKLTGTRATCPHCGTKFVVESDA